MQEIRCLNSRLELPLDRQMQLGDQALQCANVSLIAREEALIRKEEDTVPQVPVEVAHQMLGIAYGQRVLTEDVFQRPGKGALASPLDTSHHNSDLTLLGRVLRHPGHPP